MIAILSYPDAVVIAALIASAGTSAANWWNSRQANRQTKPNGGSSMRDAIDRIERKLDLDVVPRLDHGAVVSAELADRLAVIEAAHKPLENSKRSPKPRTPRSNP